MLLLRRQSKGFAKGTSKYRGVVKQRVSDISYLSYLRAALTTQNCLITHSSIQLLHSWTWIPGVSFSAMTFSRTLYRSRKVQLRYQGIAGARNKWLCCRLK